MLSKEIISAFKKKISLIIVIALVVLFASSAHFQTESGYTYHYQNMVNGSIKIYSKPAIHFKVPWFSKVTSYKQVTTVVFGNEDSIRVTRIGLPIEVRFADTYTGKISATFRYKLPFNPQKLSMIHGEFRSFDNLVDALLIKTSRDVVVNTATQYTGEEFFQGGFNQFKSALNDQLRNGIYKTERKQVEIEQIGLAPIGLGQERSTQLQRAKTLVWKTMPIMRADGEIERLTNPLDNYGIEVTQIAIGSPVPEKQLEKLLTDKKRLVADRIKAVQEQETAKEQAKTAQLLAEIGRTKARQEALKHKDLAIIAKQLEVEVSQKQAEKEIIEYNKVKELAAIEKSKELAISTAEQAIQESNLKAAQFEAQSIQEKGIARANVLKAQYDARIPEIYLAEIQRDIAAIIYPNLKGIQVSMPHNIVNLGGGNNNLKTNLDVLSSLSTIGVMEKLEKKALGK